MNSTYRIHSTSFPLICILLLFVLTQITAAQRGLGGMTPIGMQPGAPAGASAISDFENVNLFNGNLNFYLPLAKVGGRGTTATTVGLPIEMKWAVGSYVSGSFPTTIFYPYTLQDDIYGSTPFIKTKMRMRYGGDTTIGCRPNHLDPNYTEPYYSQTLTRLSFTDANGTEYELIDALSGGAIFNVPRDQNHCPTAAGQRGRIFVTKDGSSATFISDEDIVDVNEPGYAASLPHPSGYLHLSDGTVYRFGHGNIDWIRDRNGNLIDFSYAVSEQNYHIYTITDSLNRKVIIQHVLDHPTYGDCESITYYGFGGQPRTAYITYTNLSNALRSGYSIQTYAQLFPQLVGANNSNFNNKVISSLVLPNGKSYNFRYDSYGYLARVETPLGAAIEYDWIAGIAGTEPGGVVNYEFGIYRRIAERRFYGDGATLDYKTNFSRPESISTNQGFVNAGYVESDIKTANNVRLSKSRHYFYGSAASSFYFTAISYSGVYDGREYKTETFDLDGTTVLRRVTKSWMQRSGSTWSSPPAAPSLSDPLVVETTTELLDVSPKLVSKTTHIDPNNSANIAYDAFNNPTDIWEYDWGQNAAGAFLRRTHNDYITDSNYTSHTGAHIRGLVSQKWISSDMAGNNKASLTQFEYDNYTTVQNHAALVSRSNVTGHDTANFGTSYTKRGNVTAVTSYENAQTQTGAVKTYSQYDVLGNIVKTIDAKENASSVGYDDNFGAPDGEARTNSAPSQLNGLNTFALPTSSTNPLGWTSYAQFDYFTGASVNTEDINGVISKTVYNDSFDRPTQLSTGVGTSLEAQTTITYEDNDYRIRQTSDLNALNDNLLKTVSYYDKTGRTTEVRNYEASGDYKAVQTQYDALGRVYKESNPFRSTEINANNPILWTTSKFDALGRVTEVEMPDGAKVLTSYSGNAATVTDPAGKQRRSIINAPGRLTRVDEPNDSNQLGTIASPSQPTSYSYDVLNNLIQVQQIGTTAQQCGGSTSSCTQTRSFVYDSLSRLKQATNPESGTIQYSYDANGNLTSKTDARSVVTNYVYDNLNRVAQRSYTGSATPAVTYYYDNLTNAKGKLVKVSSSVSTTEYTSFDLMGRITGHKQTTDGNIYATGYAYNLSGALIEETYPSSRVVKNVLNGSGDLSNVQSRKNSSSGFWNYAHHFSYTAAGGLASMQLGNGAWESTQFNSRLQPIQIALGKTQSATNLLKLNYSYGAAANNGNVLSQQTTVPSVGTNPGFTATQTYSYDNLNRLKSAEEVVGTQTWKQTFLFDRYGNRNFDTANTTTLGNCPQPQCNPNIDPSNNRFASGQGYVYDNAGNIITDAQGRSFVYDAENKQTSVTIQSGTIGQYFYDGDGRRVKKYVPTTGETTIFVYDASGKLVAEYSTVVEPQSTAKVNYLTTDNLGSLRINTDQNAAVTARHDYYPFGAEIFTAQRVSGLNYGADNVRQKFTGYERDGESDLDMAQARYYNTSHGRFTSPDMPFIDQTIEEPQSWNLFLYVTNNPTNKTDPTGLYTISDFEVPMCLCPKRSRFAQDLPGDIKDSIYQKVYQPKGGPKIIIPPEMKRHLLSDATYFYNRGLTEGRLYNSAQLQILNNQSIIRNWNRDYGENVAPFSSPGDVGARICINFGAGGCADTSVPRTYSSTYWSTCSYYVPCRRTDSMALFFDEVHNYNKTIDETNGEWNKRRQAFDHRWRNVTTTINGRQQQFGNWALIIWHEVMNKARTRGQAAGQGY